MKEKLVYVVGGGRGYYRPFSKFGNYCDRNDSLTGSKEEVHERVSLVLFTGGSDIDPSLYGERRGRLTSYNSERDNYEVREFVIARRYGLPMVGVCRGAQFLCAMSGGRLVQHCENHGRDHDCMLWDGRVIEVSSTHHQMQIPNKDAVVLGWAQPALSGVHLDGDMDEIDIDKEVEIAHYPLTRSLGMQHHPEMQSNQDDGFKIAAELVERFLSPQY